jgi:alpha-mannosidase
MDSFKVKGNRSIKLKKLQMKIFKTIKMKRILFLILACMLIHLSGISQTDSDKTSTQKIKLIGNSHMDPVYRWRWNEMLNREIYKTFSDVLGVMDKNPELSFAQSYLLFYATVQQEYPDLFEKVKQSMNEGRWSVVGGQWVEPDETMSSGESLIRQFLVGHDYYSKNLDINTVDIAWSPDMFTGHLVTLPKIYAGCGINNYVFSRHSPKDKKIFWWKSKDGSKMLAYKIPEHYNPNYRKLPKYIESWKKIAGYDSPMVTIGEGDHGGGPDEKDFRTLKLLSNKENIEFEFTSPENYFEELRDSGMNWPVQETEFGVQPNGGQWLGCYTSQAIIKKLNRYYENQLITAEKFSVIGTLHKGKPFYPREDFLEAWKILLFNQFHDILPGTLTGLGVSDAYKDYEKLEQITSEQLNSALENIGTRINTEMDGIPLVVYNPHSWQVSQFVDAELSFVKKPVEFCLKDASRNIIPYSVLEKSDDGLKYKISIDAKDIPPMGYKVFEVLEEKVEETVTDLKIENNRIENNYYIINWDGTGISSIYSKQQQQEILKDKANKLQLLEDNGNTWGLGFTGKQYETEQLSPPEIVFSSSQKVVVKWEDYFQSSKFTRYMTVKANSNQIDFEMEVDWHTGNKLLKVVFPTNIENGKAVYDQPYGYVQREETGHDFPAQKWIDYSNTNRGVSLLNNGKYGFTMLDGNLTMSVVRGAREMDPRMDEGKHSFKYALIIHEGDWKDADIPLRAWELNQPLVAKQENHHRGEIAAWVMGKLSFPLEKSFFNIESDHVIISSIKTKQDAYNPNPIILRIVETEGRDEDVTVNLPYEARSVTECNHIEEAIEPRSEIKEEGKTFSFQIGHDQIRTFMVQF